MSGVFGLFNQNGAPVKEGELNDMASLLTRRGPERTGVWRSGDIGMGHTLLATTPEAVHERLPFEHAESGCAITGDVRLDNRAELGSALSLGGRLEAMGDVELVLHAYLAWGETCVERLLGDFAFAIWDPRSRTLTCARDHMGLRSLYYHHSPGRFFAFATEPRAILVLPQTPYRINEGRIADFLVPELEGFDKTSTFFDEVFRLPPAHTMTVTAEGVRQRHYWTLEVAEELNLGSDEAYVDAFVELFTEAIRCRLRSAGPPGAMLSGGLDSSTIVAVASRVLAVEKRPPLHTFSAVSPLGDAEPETRAIRTALTMDGLEPHMVSHGELDDLAPELWQAIMNLDEPFEGSATLLRALYLTARREKVNVVLDGMAGDVVLTEGRMIIRLLRSGRWRTAWREAAASNRFWSGADPHIRNLLRSAPAAFVPDLALRQLRPVRRRLLTGRMIRASSINPEFARHVNVARRLELIERRTATHPLQRGGIERAREIQQPYVTVARERYDRVSASLGVESRDPFLDIRVLAFCVRLPDNQTTHDGWGKVILRRIPALPEAVRWRQGSEHLGQWFTEALRDQAVGALLLDANGNPGQSDRYIDASAAQALRVSYLRGDAAHSQELYALLYLERWLERYANRPQAMTRS